MRFFRVIAALTLLTTAMPAAPILPRPSPDFANNLVQGKQIRISQYKGKTVVVAFILTYCSHCQKVVGVLSKMQSDYGARGLQVLASATEDMAAAALPGFLRQYAPTFPVGVNTTTEFIAYMQHPPMLQLNSVVVLTPTGNVGAYWRRKPGRAAAAMS